MTKKIVFLLILTWVNCAHAYEFKMQDAYAASIFGTSEENKAEIKMAPYRQGYLVTPKSKQVPDVFWYNKNLKYIKAIRKEPSPLAIMIAGTGGNHITPKVRLLGNIMYELGYSVVTLPSPSHPNFIVAASTNSSIGGIDNDVKDLKIVILNIVKELEAKHKVKFSHYVIGGYSLGAAHAAFVSYAADRDAAYPIKFSKVLMINPPYDLLESAIKIDQMFVKNVGKTEEDIAVFYERVFSVLSSTYNKAGGINLGPEIFLEAYKLHGASQEGLQALIGMAFRLSSADLVFSVDVMRRMGEIYPADKRPGNYEPLRPYFNRSLTYGFERYADKMLTRIYRKPLGQLSYETSMRRIESYLANSNKVYLMHNYDDFILKPGDIAYFKKVFGNRAIIYPYGGHCGNMEHKDNVAYIKNLFRLN